MKFEHLMSPMKVGNVTYKNRIVSAPMAFGLIVQNPEARDFTYRKLESGAAGDAEVFIVGDSIKPGQVDQCTRSGYLAAIDIARPEKFVDHEYRGKINPA